MALLHRRDQAHARAVDVWAALSRDRRLLKTTSLVVAETQALLARRVGMTASMLFLDQVVGSATGLMLWVDQDVWRTAVTTWLRRDAPGPLSVTDAVSFEVMRREKMREAFAFDEDFARAGYKLV